MLPSGPTLLHAAIKLRRRIPFTPQRTMTDSASSTTPYHAPRPRRFAPLNPAYLNTDSAPPLKGIIFDVDGTLCLPQNHMFREMRAALDIPKSVDILDHIRSLSDEPDSPSPPSTEPSEPDAFLASTSSPNHQQSNNHTTEHPPLQPKISRHSQNPIHRTLCHDPPNPPTRPAHPNDLPLLQIHPESTLHAQLSGARASFTRQLFGRRGI